MLVRSKHTIPTNKTCSEDRRHRPTVSHVSSPMGEEAPCLLLSVA